MKQSVQFEMHTRPANKQLHGNRYAEAKKTEKTRATVRVILGSQLRRVRMRLPPIPPETTPRVNRFVVTMTRISPSWVDDDGVRDALKAVRDEVASWITLDDGRKDIHLLRFAYEQQRGPGGRKGVAYHGVRIEVEDLEDSPDRPLRVVGRTPDRLGSADERAPGAIPPKRSAAAERRATVARLQETLPLARQAWAILPWDQGDDPDAEEIGTLLPALDAYKPVLRIPIAKSVARPGRWAGPTSNEINLYLHEEEDADGVPILVYRTEKPQPKIEDEKP